MKLGRRNDAAVKQFRHLIAERDQFRQELARANGTIDALMTDLGGCTLVAVGSSVGYSGYNTGALKEIKVTARLKRLTPHGRLMNLGEVAAVNATYNPAIEVGYPETMQYTFESLGAQIFRKILENNPNMR